MDGIGPIMDTRLTRRSLMFQVVGACHPTITMSPNRRQHLLSKLQVAQRPQPMQCFWSSTHLAEGGYNSTIETMSATSKYRESCRQAFRSIH